MTYSINPQSVYNGMISGQRNMFLSSSLAIAIIGFSNSFKNNKIRWVTKLVGASIFLLSILIGIGAAQDFSFYLESVKEDPPENIAFENWHRWPYISYVYSCILVIIASLFFFRKIM